MPSRLPLRVLAAATIVVLALGLVGAWLISHSPGVSVQASTPAGAAGVSSGRGTGPARTLILYDTSKRYGWLGEQYAVQTANLVSRFGSWTAEPVRSYTPGRMAEFTAVVYIGSTYDEALPATFLRDVLAGTRPALWLHDNIWQLTAAEPRFASRYGWMWSGYDSGRFTGVDYRGTRLDRNPDNGPVMGYAKVDPATVKVLGTALRADGTRLPWALRSGNLTYVGEIPFARVSTNDRYLAFCDLLFDLLAPRTPSRHRAMVRLEDVGPTADPAKLRAVGSYLGDARIPFSFGVYPVYRDPRGVAHGGVDTTVRLRDAPAVVAAIRYLISRGGTMVVHGYSHQHGTLANPYRGLSGEDFEFYRAHVDATDAVVYDGPVPGDSVAWAANRLAAAAAEFAAAGLPEPTIFEFPHYAGSVADYRAVAERFATRYERGLYYSGQLAGGEVDPGRTTSQFFPYPVVDVYGTRVLPENLGNVTLASANHNPARSPADIVASARANLVVRDGFASFFYHPYLGPAKLREVVAGVRALGYTFVSPAQVAASR